MDKILYLLTGATGLLGGNIIKQLTGDGESVRALVLPDDAAKARLPRGVEIVEGGLLDDTALDKFFSVPEGAAVCVIHAAGIVTTNPDPNEKVYAVNVTGTENIVKRCVRHKVQKLVYVSSTGAIPELPKEELIREVKTHDPQMVAGYYSKTKAIATDLVLQAAREDDLDVSVVYPSGIFGPNDYGNGLITSVITQMAKGKLRVAIGGVFNSVDARDLAAGIIACVKKGRRGETYIMASRRYTFAQLMDAICEEAGVKKPIMVIPLWIIRPIASLGTLYGKISGKNILLTRFIVYNLERNNNFSVDKAKTELGFHCRPLNETIADTIEWLKAEGKIAPIMSSTAMSKQ